MYVEDYEGRRIVCTHPLELGIVETALDIRKGTLRLGGYERPEMVVVEEKKRGSTKEQGNARGSRCKDWFLDELPMFGLHGEAKDRLRKRGRQQCCRCSSVNVKAISELLGKPCPKCNEGKIIVLDTGIVA